VLRRAAQTTVATEGEQQPPLIVRAGFQDLAGLVPGDEVFTLPVLPNRATCHVAERVLGNQASPEGSTKELLGVATTASHGVVPQLLIVGQPSAEVFSFTLADPVQRPGRSKELDQVAFDILKAARRSRLHVGPAADVLIQERRKGGHGGAFVGLATWDDQPGRGQLRVELVAKIVDPLRC
jgi:hypothetical protein